MTTSLLCRCLVGSALLAVATGSGAPARGQGLIPTHRVSAALANEAVGTAVEVCKSQGFAVSAVLVDASGARQAVLRGDNAGIHTIDSAGGKAYTSSTFKAPSGVVRERLMGNPAASGLQFVPGVLMVQGGVPIKVGEEVIGAIGVGGAPGGDKDEACAQAGIDKIKDRLK
jgi:uncharacterized protein GlcG (DUF336 family)